MCVTYRFKNHRLLHEGGNFVIVQTDCIHAANVCDLELFVQEKQNKSAKQLINKYTIEEFTPGYLLFNP